MRKSYFCICENKDADQLCSNCAADLRLCFRYIDSTIPLIPKFRNFKPLTIFCGCTARFMLDLVGNPKTGFLTTRLKWKCFAVSFGVLPINFEFVVLCLNLSYVCIMSDNGL